MLHIPEKKTLSLGLREARAVAPSAFEFCSEVKCYTFFFVGGGMVSKGDKR